MKTRALPVFPLAPDPIRPEVSRDVEAVRLTVDPIGPVGGPQIGLVTLGCDKNTVDSEKMMAALVGHGAARLVRHQQRRRGGREHLRVHRIGQGAVDRDDPGGVQAQGGGAGTRGGRRGMYGPAVQGRAQLRDPRGRPLSGPLGDGFSDTGAAPQWLSPGVIGGCADDGAAASDPLHGDTPHVLSEDQRGLRPYLCVLCHPQLSRAAPVGARSASWFWRPRPWRGRA